MQDGETPRTSGSMAQELVNNLFFGVSKDYITFDWSDYKTKKNQDAVFGPLNIDLGPKTLMASLESFYNFSIDGYKCPDVATIITNYLLIRNICYRAK